MAHPAKEIPPPPPGYRWVYAKIVIHWRSKKPMVRKDGLPFRFLVRR